MDIAEIGSEIRQARKAAGITQTELARELKMSPATISQIENGTAVWIGLGRIMRVMDRVGVMFVIRQRSMGYTLDDAQEDRHRGVKL
jgi:transcriptional regulator with XRE-family HTH domain